MVTYKLTAADWTKARIYTGHSARYGKGFLLSSTSFDHAIAQAVWVVTITMYTHYRKVVRKSMVKKGCLVRFVMQNYVFAFPTVVKEDLSSQQGEADISTNRNFLYKCMFPLQKENLCLIFRGFFFFHVLNGLWLKIIHMLKRHIWEWHILVPLADLELYTLMTSCFSYSARWSVYSSWWLPCCLYFLNFFSL